jgi:pimeloyl-ACP methyl ester carboxylesterase
LEGGQYSYAYSIPVEIPLPVIIIHGYVYTHEAGGWFLDKVKFVAYNDLMDFLAENGYTTDPSWYRTMWGPIDCQYEADKVTELGIYSDVDFWVQRALEKEDGTPRTYANKVDIIGHSTGGLVARYYAGGASTVNKVISIGTPHLGLTQFYQFAFDYSSKEQADKLFRVNPREPSSEENLLRWFEPEYGESSLVDVWGVPVPEPYENNFNAAYNPNVDYLSIYANHHTDTPYRLVVNRTKKGWYEIIDVLGGNGDGTVPELSGSGFSPDDLGPITSGVHQFLCEEPEVQKRVLDFLSGR